ncbi:TRAP transporter small permease subunit [Roseospira visakhapatnamensis]|uniref:TRAP transporter small permease protein n=1 Tax=Roseospira visakhapatnamensis TaxID=390880 RepID=A0A7W6W8U7_9PROT|nr:TRAP transporter small permease subunit [Roseospira visakhapatnamensis]MBB4264786.1 TRAP-type mannitol/chloroaromatic compound transport system permease small subunit [Roseospira visakhapatnamensis]
MTALKKILSFVDSLSEWSGAIGKWFAFLLVLVGTFETVSRHFFDAPTIWAYDTLCMAGGVTYLLGASYVYRHDAHTRVDIFYSRCSPRRKALLDVICALIFFFPLMTVMFEMAVSWALRAWRINEVMFNSFWYPPAAPYRTIFALGLFLLLLQALAKLIRDVHLVLRGKDLD